MTGAIAGPAQGRATKAGWLMLAGIVLASLTEAIAGTLLSLSRGDMIGDIHATPDEFASLDVAYAALKLLGFAWAPWLLTRLEPRAALLSATLAMGAACLLAAGTARLDLLVALRAMQGLSGAVLLVSGQVFLFRAYPSAGQPLLQAIFAMGSVVAPATLAPALEGWLLDSGSWNWIFLVNLPLSLAAAGLILMSDPGPTLRVAPRQLDWAGLALLALALVPATYVLSQGSRWDWFEADRIVWLTLAAAAGLVLFIARQWRGAPGSLLDLRMFETDDFTFAFLVSFVAGAALFGSAFLIPAFATSVLGVTPTEAGQLLLPSGLLFALALLIAAFLMQARKVPPIATVPLGILLIMVAMWMLSGSTAQSGATDMMPAILLRGLGLGFLFLSITLIAFSRLPAAQLAFGIGLFNLGRQLGGLIGIAGLQTAIDHQVATGRTVLGAALNPGSPAVAERLAATANALVSRGMESSAAARAGAGLLWRAVTIEASVIAFNAAFLIIALIFVAAAPLLIGAKLALARLAGRRGDTGSDFGS